MLEIELLKDIFFKELKKILNTSKPHAVIYLIINYLNFFIYEKNFDICHSFGWNYSCLMQER
jgi:hypothetical protein